jgi:hypothetical protein
MEYRKLDADSSVDAMSVRSTAKLNGWSGTSQRLLVLALLTGCFVPVHAETEVQLKVSEAPKQLAARHGAATSLDDRVRALSKVLTLGAKQQADVRKVLEGQREQVRCLWEDTTVLAEFLRERLSG